MSSVDLSYNSVIEVNRGALSTISLSSDSDISITNWSQGPNLARTEYTARRHHLTCALDPFEPCQGVPSPPWSKASSRILLHRYEALTASTHPLQQSSCELAPSRVQTSLPKSEQDERVIYVSDDAGNSGDRLAVLHASPTPSPTSSTKRVKSVCSDCIYCVSIFLY